MEHNGRTKTTMYSSNFKSLNLMRFLETGSSNTPQSSTPPTPSPLVKDDGTSRPLAHESSSSMKKIDRADSHVNPSSCAMTSNPAERNNSRGEIAKGKPVTSSKQEPKLPKTLLRNIDARDSGVMDEFADVVFTSQSCTPRACHTQSRGVVSAHRVSFTCPTSSRPVVIETVAFSNANARAPNSIRAQFALASCGPTTSTSVEDFRTIRRINKNSNAVSHISVHGNNQVSSILEQGSVHSLSSDSDECAARASPNITISQSHGSQFKTLSQIGHNTVTFSPSRSNLKAELCMVRRTGDIAPAEKGEEELDSGCKSFQSASSSYSRESHFKTVTLLQGSVSQWFTGHNREKSALTLPTILEEDEPLNDDFDDPEEDIF